MPPSDPTPETPGPVATDRSTEGTDMTSTVADASTLDRARWAHLTDLVTTAADRPPHASRAPFDGTLIGEVPLCTADDVALAVSRARAAQPAWAGLPIGRRCAIARRFADLVLEREAEILDLVQAETGKSRMSAFEELADVALTAAYYARTAARHLRPRHRRGAIPVLTKTVELRQPKGQGSRHGAIVRAGSGAGFDLVAQDEISTGVAGLGGGEVLTQLGDGCCGAPGRQRVKADRQDTVAGVDVTAAGQRLTDQGVRFVVRAGVPGMDSDRSGQGGGCV